VLEQVSRLLLQVGKFRGCVTVIIEGKIKDKNYTIGAMA
jgi:hypothetical protein